MVRFKPNEMEKRSLAVGLSVIRHSDMRGVPAYMPEIAGCSDGSPMCCLCHYPALEVVCEESTIISLSHKIGWFCTACAFGYLYRDVNAARVKLGFTKFPEHRYDQILDILEGHLRRLGRGDLLTSGRVIADTASIKAPIVSPNAPKASISSFDDLCGGCDCDEH